MNNDPNYATTMSDGTIRSSGRRPTKRGKRHPRPAREAGSSIPTNSIIRGACYATSQADHAEIAAAIANGNMSVRWKNGDAAGPLRENVGLTTQRGGVLDYNHQQDHRYEAHSHPDHLGGSYAHLIAAYNDRTRS